jgi:serine/threonine-protein kinase
MADVFLARDEASGKLIALKRVRSGGSDPTLRRRFQREAEVNASLSHPNIVRMLDSGVDDEGPYLALEYVDGVNARVLFQSLSRADEVLPVTLWCVLALDLSAALLHAHRHRGGAILHRDLSPENVLIGVDGIARLADFGIAHWLEATRVTEHGSVRGKVAYMSSELLEGGDPSTASEVYSLAVVLFELASGVLPFLGDTEAALVRSILMAAPAQLGGLRPDLPAEAVAWVDSALGREAVARPALEALGAGFAANLDLSQARADLGRLVQRLSVRDPADRQTEREVEAYVPPAESTVKAPRFEPSRRWMLLTLAATGAVVAGVAVPFFLTPTPPPPSEAPQAAPAPIIATVVPPPTPAVVAAEPPAPVEPAPVVAVEPPQSTPERQAGVLAIRVIDGFAHVFNDGEIGRAHV